MPWTWLSFISLIASRPGFSLTANNCFQLTVLSMLFQWFPDEKGVASCFSFTLLLWSFFFFFFLFFCKKKITNWLSALLLIRLWHDVWSFHLSIFSPSFNYDYFLCFGLDEILRCLSFFPLFSFLFNVSFYRLLPWMNDLSIRLEIKFASRLH